MKHPTLTLTFAVTAIFSLLLCLQACKQDDKILLEENLSNKEKPAQAVQPDNPSTVDLARWKDMTWEDFDRLFADFTASDPPVIRNYGICDSITCIFPNNSKDASIEILICDLDAEYSAVEAFQQLGIGTGRVIGSEAGWVQLASDDNRFASLKYKTTGNNAEHTRQLLLQFKR